MPDTIRAKDSTEIAETIENYFLSGEVDKVEIAYSRFINLISNEPAIRTLLPLSPTGIEDPEDETFKLTTEDGKLKAWQDGLILKTRDMHRKKAINNSQHRYLGELSNTTPHQTIQPPVLHTLV